MKSRRKLVSILLTLSLLVAMLVPMVGPAFAAGTVTAGTTPNVTATITTSGGSSTANVTQLGQIKIDGLSVAGGTYDQIQVLLPSGVKFADGSYTVGTTNHDFTWSLSNLAIPAGPYNAGVAAAVSVTDNASDTVLSTPQYVPNTSVPNSVQLINTTAYPITVSDGGQLLSFTVFGMGGPGAGTIRINPVYNIGSAGSGPVKITVQDTAQGLSSGTLVIGSVVSGGTTTNVTTTASMAQNASDNVTFVITENTAGALQAGSGYNFYADLPAHFTWVGPNGTSTPTVVVTGGFPSGDVVPSVTTNGSGNSRLSMYINTASTTMAGTIQVQGAIRADYNAPTGDITASFGSNNSGFTAATATVGTCSNYSVNVTASGTPNIFNGETGQSTGNVTIAEGVKNTLINTRSISLTLPGGVRFAQIPTVTQNSGSVTLTSPSVSSDRQTYTWTIGNSNPSVSSVTISQIKVDVDANVATGNLTATLNGSGISQTVDIAKIVSPASGTASATPNVVIGQASQDAGDMTIVENAPGALMANPSETTYTITGGSLGATSSNQSGYLNIIAPSGITFASVPTIKVTSGDLNLSTTGATLTSFNNVINNMIQIPVTNGSTTASTVSVTGIKLNLDNTVATGPVSLWLGGSALINQNSGINGSYVTSVPVATCTSSINKTTGGTAVFTIGSTDFTMNSAKQTMDAAPYLKNDRTYLPIRFVAQAVGVPDSNIIWNGDEQSVTLIKGGTVVKLVIGSTTMTINGTSVTMDTAPEIVDPGRTMLPVSWVAKALGCQINWDAATQTVTVQG